ncbi:hypothetical protein GCM10010112_17320 [Actinoplanes lobatus]|uniref:Uncharacterized protein n=1 Tax=Actinoplanes lobatus TaxID=113568 RepID=A0ABQ4AJL8_9ACTN|nr:hypothetical protein GCM10010112_17320 [Actinoplanes lobatus]GIE41196.1 hypothetical protein Alo02nite_40940 [Actinoplanes lobatus]
MPAARFGPAAIEGGACTRAAIKPAAVAAAINLNLDMRDRTFLPREVKPAGDPVESRPPAFQEA